MQDERNPNVTCALDPRDLAQRAVLDLLLADSAHGFWSTQELAQALGDPANAADAIAELHAHGVVHVTGGLVCPSRATAHLCELWLQGSVGV